MAYTEIYAMVPPEIKAAISEMLSELSPSVNAQNDAKQAIIANTDKKATLGANLSRKMFEIEETARNRQSIVNAGR